MNFDDIKKLLGGAATLLSSIEPHIAAAVQVGVIAADVYNDIVAARAEIQQLAAQDKVTKEQVDALDDSIQARHERIKALLNPPADG